ncbi:MAG TPA: hypothetical protein VK427_09760 [Kofleriaceae bacterium]|nr:hypothetical protein [Kofleriaceae bacterium]
MFTKTRVGGVMWAGLMLGLLSQDSWANDKNFKAAADQVGCKSLITRDGIEECQKVQGAKNIACNRPTECELSKQEDWAKEYDELYRWWGNEGSKLPDNSFKSDKQRQMRDLVRRLANGRSAATAGVMIANECIQARNAVQKWFENVAIPLTERTRNELVPIRRGLVDRFNETKAKRDEAKKKYDDKPSDDGLRRDWEAARDANIEAGRKLDEFDKTYGPDIQYYSDKLVSHYQSEKTNHDRPSQQAENRLTTCEKTVKVEWKDLPF